MSQHDQDLSTDDLVRQPDRDQPGDQAGQPSRDATAAPAGAVVDTARDAGLDDDRPLLDQSESDDYRGRWDDIQTGFVDEPRESVARADTLVAEVMRHLAETFSRERGDLEAQWDRGDDVSTEDLRLALQRYRSFFNRLLGA